MKWNNVIEGVKSITVEEAKTFLESHDLNSFYLLDVRQPEEFSKKHIPGATLLPLSELVAGMGNLEKDKTVLVYSRGEGRSLAGTRWLDSQGFKDVRRIEGGIQAWDGGFAFGHLELNLDLLNPNAEFADAISMAYAMEEGLQQFYIQLARETEDETFKKLYHKLASFEVDHKRELAQMYSISSGKELVQKELDLRNGQILEGGGYADITLIKTLANTENAYDVFSLAIAFETQALDFYMRLASRAEKEEVRKFFIEMAEAERKHLLFVSREMDRYIEEENELFID